MSCYQCASEGGTSAQLCQECIRANQKFHEDQGSAFRAELRGMREEKGGTRLLENPLFLFFLYISTLLSLFIAFLIWPQSVKYGALTCFILAVDISFWIVAFSTHVLLWTKVTVSNPIASLVSLFIPSTILREIFLNWDEYKMIASIYFGSTFLAIVLKLVLGRYFLIDTAA